MDRKEAENFFTNVNWFNSFFNDMKTLFDRLANIAEKEAGYTNKFLYYYKHNDKPHIPSLYYVALEGEGKPKVQIVAAFDRDFIKNVRYSPLSRQKIGLYKVYC